MPVDPRAAVADIDAVLNHRPASGGIAGVAEVASMIKACIERWAPIGSSYRRMVDTIDPLKIKLLDADLRLRGVLITLQRDYHAGMTGTIEAIGHASVYEELIRQAERFLDAGHRWPAAVVIGAALEEHLRQLASKLGIPFEVPDSKGVLRAKAPGRVNDDLHSVPAYGQADWQQIQLWIAIRDDAALGRPAFEARKDQELARMAAGVREFIRRHPA